MSVARKMFLKLNKKKGKSFIRIKTATSKKKQLGDWYATIKIKIADRAWDAFGWQGFLLYDRDSYSVVGHEFLSPFPVEGGFKDTDEGITMFGEIKLQFPVKYVKPGKYTIARIYFEGKSPGRGLTWVYDREDRPPVAIGMQIRKGEIVYATPLIAVDSDGEKHKVVQP